MSPKNGRRKSGSQVGNDFPGLPAFQPEDLRNLEHSDVAQMGGPLEIARKLGVENIKQGLPSATASKNRSHFGSNELPTKQPRGFVSHLMESFEDATLVILIVSAVVSIGFGLWTQ